MPSTGTVEVLGHDVSRLAPLPASARRPRPRLPVGALVRRPHGPRDRPRRARSARAHADHVVDARVPTVVGSRALFKRTEAADIIRYVGLDRFADEFVSNLSTGTRAASQRLACQLADGRAGPAPRRADRVVSRNARTEAFGPLIMQVRRELDAAVLLIEHDMSLVMQVSDRVYCLEAGRVIAEGRPGTGPVTTRWSLRPTSGRTSAASSARAWSTDPGAPAAPPLPRGWRNSLAVAVDASHRAETPS